MFDLSTNNEEDLSRPRTNLGIMSEYQELSSFVLPESYHSTKQALVQEHEACNKLKTGKSTPEDKVLVKNPLHCASDNWTTEFEPLEHPFDSFFTTYKQPFVQWKDNRDVFASQTSLPWISESGKICYVDNKKDLEEKFKSLSIEEDFPEKSQKKGKHFHPYKSFVERKVNPLNITRI